MRGQGVNCNHHPSIWRALKLKLFIMKNNVDKAMETLQNAGYYVDNLWSILDVQSKFKCTEDEAFEVLDSALNNDWIMEQINDVIWQTGESMGLTEEEDEDE